MAILGFDPLFVSVLIVYFVITVAIGVYGYITTKDEAGFLVADREIGPAVGAAALSATQMSAGTFVGTLGVHYLTGVSWAYLWIGLWLGWLVSLVFVAPQMRRFGAFTVPDFFAARFGDDGHNGGYMRAISALLIIVAYTVYISAQYVAAGLIFQTLFGVPTVIGMVLMVAVVLLYTTFGGMRAGMLTDFIQMMVMVVGAIISIPILLEYIGGLQQLDLLLTSFDPELVGLAYTPIELGTVAAAFGFGMIASPKEIVHIYSMQDEQTVRQAIGLTLFFQVIIATSVAVIGVGMVVLYPQLSSPDLASIILSINVLGPVLGALVIAAILSAMLSTIDSVLIVAGGGLAHDIYTELLNPEMTETQKLWANRIGSVVIGILPVFLALYQELLGGLVQLIVLLQAALLGAAFSIPVLLGLHWKRVNTHGSFFGMISGFVMVIVWHFGQEFGIITGLLAQFDPVIPGVIACLAGIVIGTYATRPPSRESLRQFFDVDGEQPTTDD